MQTQTTLETFAVDTDYVDNFTDAYKVCALWSSTDNADEQGGEPLDKNYSVYDIHPASAAKMQEECNQFVQANATDLQYVEPGNAGHDFWLTRNRHGAGFWDRGLGAPGERLTAASHKFRECDIYPGDDGMLHVDNE